MAVAGYLRLVSMLLAATMALDTRANGKRMLFHPGGNPLVPNRGFGIECMTKNENHSGCFWNSKEIKR